MSRKAHPVDRTRVKQRVRLKRQSQKMALLENQRRILIRQWFDEAAAKTEVGYALCEAGLHVCGGVATDPHEVKMRSRDKPEGRLDRGNVRLVCRHCHTFIHANPLIATQMGLLESQFQRREDD